MKIIYFSFFTGELKKEKSKLCGFSVITEFHEDDEVGTKKEKEGQGEDT